MSPAFASTRHAAVFGAVILFFLTLPVTLHHLRQIPREQEYRGISERAGAFDYIRREIFEQRSDLDIVFCGTSLLNAAIDAEYVEQELSRSMGRQTTVKLLPQSWQGPDMNYFVLRDFLEHRRAGMVVIAAPAWIHHANLPHVQLFRVIKYGEDPGALDGLDLRHRLSFYAAYILGAPRHALNLLRPNLADPPQAAPHDEGIRQGFHGTPFVEHKISAPQLPPRSLIYSQRTSFTFHFDGPPLNGLQLHFLRKTAELTRAYHIPLVILHMPSPTEHASGIVPDRQLMPEILGDGVFFAGVSSAGMFENTPDSQFFDYFYDEHMNRNGKELYTRTIAPALIGIYRGYADSR
jgi:hypothetical protein